MARIQKEVLVELIQNNLPKQDIYGIEIGTLGGNTLDHLLSTIPYLRMITIDPSPQWNDLGPVLSRFTDRARVLHMRSDEAIILLNHPSYKNNMAKDGFDIIWVDGDHSCEQVKRDILNYLPLVKIGGIFGGHDYVDVCQGVKQAVDELKGRGYKIQLGEDGIWWTNV